MRTIFAEHADAPVGVAKDDEILAEHAHFHRRAVRLGHFLAHQRGQPVAAHHLAHRGIALDAALRYALDIRF